jgi:hypothetical protein
MAVLTVPVVMMFLQLYLRLRSTAAGGLRASRRRQQRVLRVPIELLSFASRPPLSLDHFGGFTESIQPWLLSTYDRSLGHIKWRVCHKGESWKRRLI